VILWTKYGVEPDRAEPPMAMDYRHVEMLYTELLVAQPRVAVEIGSHKGHSLVAFLEVMKVLPEMVLHVFDPHVTPELAALTYEFGDSRVFIHQEPVWESTLTPDFVFIDGDHGLPALADLAWCLIRKVRVIAMHDTRTAPRLKECWGAAKIADWMRMEPGRGWAEDFEDRPGEWTWRGFGVSTLLTE
jgi:predicted O-methyltransferase YrrM